MGKTMRILVLVLDLLRLSHDLPTGVPFHPPHALAGHMVIERCRLFEWVACPMSLQTLGVSVPVYLASSSRALTPYESIFTKILSPCELQNPHLPPKRDGIRHLVVHSRVGLLRF